MGSLGFSAASGLKKESRRSKGGVSSIAHAPVVASYRISSLITSTRLAIRNTWTAEVKRIRSWHGGFLVSLHIKAKLFAEE